jgi:hypothetical protein
MVVMELTELGLDRELAQQASWNIRGQTTVFPSPQIQLSKVS